MTGSVSALPAKRATPLSVRLSHLSAVAVMIALVGAMFVAMGSASAAGCSANPGITLGFTGNCTIDVAKIHDKANGLEEVVPQGGTAILNIGASTVDGDPATNIMITALSTTGTRTVNVTAPDNTNKPDDADGDVDVVGSFEVTVVGFGIAKVEIVGDSDNVVSAGAPVIARVTLRSQSTDATVSLTVPTTGLSIAQTVGTPPVETTTQSLNLPNDPDTMYDFTVNTAGAPAGEYTLSFAADNDPDTADKAGSSVEAEKADSATLTLTIGDPGTGLDSATLSLGNSSPDLPYTDKDEGVAEDGTEDAAEGDINLVVEVFDSSGGKANPGSVTSVTLIAPGGKISHGAFGDIMAVSAASASPNSIEIEETDATPLDAEDANQDDVGQRAVFTIAKANGKPGAVTVYALVIGSSGAARTNEVTLTFSGPATVLSVADATETLLSVNVDGDDSGDDVDPDEYDSIKLVVSAEDAGGNNATPPKSASVVITDPDGKRIGDERIEDDWPTAASADGKRYLMLTGKGSTSAPLAAGEYTVKVTSGKLEATAMFAVAGNPSSVDVSASATSSDMIGDVITVTAAVTDADGNKVSDGTSVQFDVSANTGLAAIGTGHMGKGTKDGSASVKYAVVGAGHSVVSATAGGATGVIVIDSTAGATEMAMPEEEASVACLSNLAGFATWACGVESSASEIFGLVSGRGATALHLWNGSAWVRYSVVDGTMVPGSSDFMVAENDILYISN